MRMAKAWFDSMVALITDPDLLQSDVYLDLFILQLRTVF